MIFDCFTFFNELDLLEVRLHELNQEVDKFVLVEASFTFQGTPKPLYYAENKERFSAFHHKIVHVVLRELPQHHDAWDLETFQRDSIALGLKEAKPDDTILISDVDEIPTVRSIRTAAMSNRNSVLLMDMYYYYINCLSVRQISITKRIRYFFLSLLHIPKYVLRHHELYNWYGTAVCRFKELNSCQQMREQRQNIKHFPNLIKNGGWHFSYLGGIEKIRTKLESFAHAELNTKEMKDENKLYAYIREGKCMHDPQSRLQIVNIEDKAPAWIITHMDLYRHWIFDK